MGKNALGDLMSKISSVADLSCKYTNHCIRATSITVLSHQGVQAQNIQSLSGHKSVDSLKHYVQAPDQKQKRDMSSILHNFGNSPAFELADQSHSSQNSSHADAHPHVPPVSTNTNSVVVPPCKQAAGNHDIMCPVSQQALNNAPMVLSGMFSGANISGNLTINFQQYTSQNK